MDRSTVQGQIACALAKYDRPLEATCKRLAELEVDKAESGEVGKVGYRKEKNDGTSTRVAVRVGKFVRQFFGEGLNDQSVQDIGANITALLWSGNDADEDDASGVKELSGESLRHFYLMSVSGICSCMAHEDTQDFLDIYADNPDVVKLATVRIDGHAARALVWTFPDGSRYMDRMYHTSEACHAALKNYAERHGIGLRSDIPKDRIRMKIRDGEDSHWPYIDTLYYVRIDGQKDCTLSTMYGDYCVQTTDGRLENHGPVCYDCGCQLDEGEVYSDDDGNAYCEECYNDRFFCCEHCGNECYLEGSVETSDGVRICEQCYDRHYFTCEECGQIYHNDHVHDVDGDRYVCDECFEECYFACEDCGALCRMDELHAGPNHIHVCEDCAERYAECSECGTIMKKDVLVDGMCPDCAMEKMEAACTAESSEDVNDA